MLTKIEQQILVAFSPAQMFALVNDINAYPLFLPYCTNSKVHAETPEYIEASLDIEIDLRVPLLNKPFKQTFSSRNTLHFPHKIEMSLCDGPLKNLKGTWSFCDHANGATVALQLSIEFNNPLYAMAFNTISSQVSTQLLQAFVRRAQEVYGD